MVWAVLSLFILGPEFFFGGWSDDYRLATIGQTTIGRVTSVQPDNHDSCTYGFEVKGHDLSDSQQLCPTGARVGGPIAVTYLSSNPTISIVSSPWSALQGAIIFGVGVPALMARCGLECKDTLEAATARLGLDWQG